MKTESLLLLKHNSFRQETKALFDLLSSSPMARESFFNNPSGVMRAMFTFTHSDLETTQDDSAANRLLFSIVSNPKFFEFLERHQNSTDPRLTGLIETLPAIGTWQLGDKAQILKEFTAAFAECGDKEILEGLLTADGVLAGSPDLSPIIVLVLLVVVGVIAVFALAVDHHAVPTGPSVTAAEMRSLAEALAMQAKLARTSGTPFVFASNPATPVAATPWIATRSEFVEPQRAEAN